MTNMEKYVQAFVKALEIEPEQVEGLTYQMIESWDSIGHMTLIATLEETFGIMMETDDIIDFSSFEVGKDIMKKYGIGLS